MKCRLAGFVGGEPRSHQVESALLERALIVVTDGIGLFGGALVDRSEDERGAEEGHPAHAVVAVFDASAAIGPLLLRTLVEQVAFDARYEQPQPPAQLGKSVRLGEGNNLRVEPRNGFGSLQLLDAAGDLAG